MTVVRRTLPTALGLAAALLAWPTSPVTAQAAPPRVALVLGGGGARGIAHVGALRVIEEAGVPIDLVVGTSMGAVVGALYAAGVPPAEMEAWLASADWDALFSDSPPYGELSFRRKRRVREYPIGLELGLNREGIRLPSGLIAGQKLTTTLRHLLLRASAVRDFDSLAIPLRVVATDMASGEPVVLDGGDLVGAIRASMSAPGVFTPWPLDGRLLGDGGLTDNLPVDVARQLGADVVIAVDVGTPLAPQEELRTVVALTRQVATLLTQSGARANRQELGTGDLLIRPDLGGHRATDFAGSAGVAAMGEAAARSVWPRLRELAAAPSSYREWRRRVRAFDARPATVEFIALESRGRPIGQMVRRLQARSGALDTAAIRQDLQTLYSHGLYEAVDYELVPTGEGTLLQYRTREKAWGPNYLRFRLAVSDDLEGLGSYNVGVHLLAPNVNDWGAELVLEAELGSERRTAVELFQPLGPASRVFVAPYARYDRVPTERVEGDRSVARVAVETARTGIAIGAHFGHDGELRLGVEQGVITTEPLTAPPEMEPGRVRTGGAFAELAVDGMDEPFFPRRGYVAAVRLDAEREGLGGDADYDRLAADLIGVTSIGAPRVLLGLSGVTTFGDDLPAHRRAGPGGPLVLSGYRPGELSGNHMVLARTIVFAEMRRDLFLALSLEAGNAWETRGAVDPADLRIGSTVSVAARTPLGPAYLGYGIGEGGRRQAFLVLGRGL